MVTKWRVMPVLFIALILLSFNFSSDNNAVAKEFISQIKATRNLGEQTKLYRQLIEKAGPTLAQEALYRSDLPFNGQTHLLNHAVGDWLYEKYGPAGLVQCKDYFLSSCYHGFVIMAIARGGMPEVVRTMEECRKSGPNNFTQCAHSVGHGLLASEGYPKLLEALKLCDQVDLPGGGLPLYNCYDGVFMENVWGVHDGKPSPDRWIKNNDPFYPCNDPRIDKKYHLGCWSNQPTVMYQMFKGDLKRAGLECGRVADKDNREMCFNGLARQIQPLTGDNLDKVFQMCGQMPVGWIDYCISTNAKSSFSVGNRELPFAVCNKAEGPGRDDCYEKLIDTVRAYRGDFNKLCPKIQDQEWREKCLRN